jgi:outer membrane receptor protein involved in Fe transport
MKKIFTILICLITIHVKAQVFSISGKVNDQKKEPVLGAVLSLSQEGVLVKMAITNTDGTFVLIDIKKGNYKLTINSLGFTNAVLNVVVSNKNLNLETIILKQSNTELDAVKVVATKPIVQVMADKTIFNVENTISAAGSNGWELLRKAPGLTIDNAGSIIVEGKTGVQIYIDGKPSQLRGTDLQAYLENLQSSTIGSIEIITQPSSKYDAAGTAGIINIKFKKNQNLGTNGSANSSATYGDFARLSNSVSINNRTQKGNLYGNLSNGIGKGTGFLFLLRQQNQFVFDAKTFTENQYNSNNFRLGYDLFANAKNTFGVIVNGNLNNRNTKNNSRTPIAGLNSNTLDSVLIANNKSEGNANNYNINLNYRFADTLGRSLNLDADYGNFNSNRAIYQPNFYFNNTESQILSSRITQQITPTNINIATFKADYEQNLYKGKLALGLKLSYVFTDNNFNFFNQINNQFVKNNTLSNQFNYTEVVNAAYFNYNKKWEKWDAQFGLRLENTSSDGDLKSTQSNINNRVKRNYLNAFPSGGLTYQINKNNQFGLTYSKRIERPNYSSLNPFEFKIDELSSSRGNPFLQPQYTDNLKLSHTYKYTLNTSISYSYIRDFFAQITEAEGLTKNFMSERNIANQSVIDLGISYPFNVSKWWNVYASVNAYQSNYKATNPGFVPVIQNTLSLYGQNTFTIKNNFKMELSGWYSSPSVWGGTYRTKSLGSLSLAFQQKFFKEKLNARLAFNDILYTSPWQGITQFGNLMINGSGGNDSRTGAISLSYNFGSSKIKSAKSRKAGLDDEKQRTGN